MHISIEHASYKFIQKLALIQIFISIESAVTISSLLMLNKGSETDESRRKNYEPCADHESQCR